MSKYQCVRATILTHGNNRQMLYVSLREAPRARPGPDLDAVDDLPDEADAGVGHLQHTFSVRGRPARRQHGAEKRARAIILDSWLSKREAARWSSRRVWKLASENLRQTETYPQNIRSGWGGVF